MEAIDGTKFFGSDKKFCPGCLKNNKYNFHSRVVISTIGDGPSLTVGFKMYKPGVDSASKDEGELSVAKRLITDVSRTYKNLFDVVVYDALACNSKWISHWISLDINVVIRAKENKLNSLRRVKKITNKKESAEIWENEKGFESIKVFESTFYMDKVNQLLRFVTFSMKHKDGRHSQILIVTTCLEMSLKT